jgi:hypothetical protein
MRYVQWPTNHSIGRRTGSILKHQRHAPPVRERGFIGIRILSYATVAPVKARIETLRLERQ